MRRSRIEAIERRGESLSLSLPLFLPLSDCFDIIFPLNDVDIGVIELSEHLKRDLP